MHSENQARTNEAKAREAEKRAQGALLSEAQEREKAVAERRRAEEALLARRTAVYSNVLQEADRAWLLNDLPKAINTLDACPVEQRRWEWQFLRRLYQGGLLTLEGGSNPLGVAFSPDGKRLATACSDKAVRVWDPLTGQVLLSLTGHTNSVFKAVRV